MVFAGVHVSVACKLVFLVKFLEPFARHKNSAGTY